MGCKNGATCTDSTTESAVSYHAYQCTCVAGFANGVCEYKQNKNKPSKLEFIKEYRAECTVSESMAQWKNKTLSGNCDIDVNEYKKNPKEKSPNKDHDFIKEYKTECTVFESMASPNNAKLGGNCDIDVNECASKPCKNGATCTDSTTESAVSYHAYQCTCVAGFANGVCEYDYISEFSKQ